MAYELAADFHRLQLQEWAGLWIGLDSASAQHYAGYTTTHPTHLASHSANARYNECCPSAVSAV